MILMGGHDLAILNLGNGDWDVGEIGWMRMGWILERGNGLATDEVDK